jgi:hypothetical protein
VTAVISTATFGFELTDQGGGRLGDLMVSRDLPGTLSMDTSQPMKRTLRGLLLPLGELADVDTIRDRVRLTMTLDGVLQKLGLYLFTSPSEEALTAPILSSAGSFAHLDFVDQLLIVDQLTSTAYSIAPGANITDFLVTLAGTLPVAIDITPSGAVVGDEALTWPPATSALAIFNQCATMLGYHELYFGNDEIGHLGPMPDPLSASDNDVMKYDGRVARPSATRENSLLDVPNRFIVVGSGATQQAIVGIYDVPADAPHSFVNRGFYVTYSEQQQGIATVAQANDAAAALARQRSFAYETLTFGSPINPLHDHYNVVELEFTRYLEMSWSYQLKAGAVMQHVVRKTYAV